VGDLLRKLGQAYGSLGFPVKVALAVGFALVTTAFGVAMVVLIPADHFQSRRPEPASWWRAEPVLRWSGLLIKNAVGVVFVALGAVMALPLVPGPGLVFILLGVSVLDFPGKRNLERKLLGVPSVIRFLNGVRVRFGRSPLLMDGPDAPGDDTARDG
jgi:hypothetical protein